MEHLLFLFRCAQKATAVAVACSWVSGIKTHVKTLSRGFNWVNSSVRVCHRLTLAGGGGNQAKTSSCLWYWGWSKRKCPKKRENFSCVESRPHVWQNLVWCWWNVSCWPCRYLLTGDQVTNLTLCPDLIHLEACQIFTAFPFYALGTLCSGPDLRIGL